MLIYFARIFEEADESTYWSTVIRDFGCYYHVPLLHELIKEANKLTAIFAATDKTAKSNIKNQTSKNQRSDILCIYKEETEF